MLVLGLESSCDETAAAVVEDGRRILSSVISSQIEVHAPYGGVVPELASRHHVANLLPVLRSALDQAGIGLTDLDALAATRGPGLVGSLLIALSAAKSLALVLDKPLIGVDHLKGHIAAAFLEETRPQLPAVALIVSGGHTSLYRLESLTDPPQPLGATLDDAVGEAFDKVGKLLGLAYPAGPIIERLAAQAKPTIDFPRPMMDGSLNFSFSGLKTAVMNYVQANRIQQPGEPVAEGETPLVEVCASFQAAAIDVLVTKTALAAQKQQVGQVIMVGGVAANQTLKRAMTDTLNRAGAAFHSPSPVLCTDNAAMIAAAGFNELAAGRRHDWDIDAVSRVGQLYSGPSAAL